MTAWQLRQAVRVLHGGGVIAYPTESVYGLGCDPLNAEAVLELLSLKQRSITKGLILIAADFSQLRPYISAVPPRILKKIRSTWPGTTTWLLPAHQDTPPWLCGAHASLAVRVTGHPVAAAICRAFNGPLVSTSANISGQPPARSALQVRRHFADSIDYLLTGAVGPYTRPSQIRDAVSDKVIRAGP